MPTETQSSSAEAQSTIEQLALSSDANIACSLEQCSAEVLEQVFNALIVRLDALAQNPDQPGHSEQYDRLSAVLDQVRTRRGFQAMDEAI